MAQELSDKLDLVLDGGRSQVGVESTIIALTGSRPCLLRAGGTPIEELESLLGKLDRLTDSPDRPLAPGQLKRHYATRTPLQLVAGSPDDLLLATGREGGGLDLEPAGPPRTIRSRRNPLAVRRLSRGGRQSFRRASKTRPSRTGSHRGRTGSRGRTGNRDHGSVAPLFNTALDLSLIS